MMGTHSEKAKSKSDSFNLLFDLVPFAAVGIAAAQPALRPRNAPDFFRLEF